MDQNVCKGEINCGVTQNSSLQENRIEKMSNKNDLEKLSKQQKKYLEANKNISLNNETIYLNIERLSKSHNESIYDKFNVLNVSKNNNTGNNESISKSISTARSSVISKRKSYCCSTLSESGTASAKFSMVICLVLLLICVQVFFKRSEEDDTTIKMLAFGAGVYALCYLHCARKLMWGIEKEVTNKFSAWIAFSVSAVLLFFSGAFYVIISSWDELSNISEQPRSGCQTLALVFLLALIGSLLIYCTWIVLLLWNSLHVEENSLKGSCVKFLYNLCNSCKLSLNSFSHAASK